MNDINFSQVNIGQFKDLLKEEDIVLLDVRTPDEIPVYGKISQQQIGIDINNPIFSIEINKLDKTKKYLVYCWHGNRSKTARNYMRELGFEFVVDLEGGIDAWKRSGEHVIK